MNKELDKILSDFYGKLEQLKEKHGFIIEIKQENIYNDIPDNFPIGKRIMLQEIQIRIRKP